MKKPDWKAWLSDKEENRFWLNSYFKRQVLRKRKDESLLYLKKADHNFNLAGWLVEKHKKEIPELFGKETFYDWVINIYYYGVYHAALALMSREGYVSKSHSATLCFLIYHHYHQQKALDKEEVMLIAASLEKEEVETLGFSKELREKACYEVHELFEQKLAEQVREQAVNFVNKIKLLLE